jgi:predicted membrane protein
MTMTQRSSITPQLVIGVSVMLVGVLLTLDQAGLLRARDILRFWPVALIALGAVAAAQAQDRSRMAVGMLQMFFGTWLLLTTMHVLPARSWRLFWPLLLVFTGWMLVVHTIRRRDEGLRGDPRETVNIFGVLGGGNRTLIANPFRGGDLFAIMGGGRLDLRRAVIPPGGHAVLEVFSMMGGYELLVPETWAIDDRTLPILGGVGNETRLPTEPTPPTLVLRGVLFLGGIGIRN